MPKTDKFLLVFSLLTLFGGFKILSDGITEIKNENLLNSSSKIISAQIYQVKTSNYKSARCIKYKFLVNNREYLSPSCKTLSKEIWDSSIKNQKVSIMYFTTNPDINRPIKEQAISGYGKIIFSVFMLIFSLFINTEFTDKIKILVSKRKMF
ncbi:MAG: hypothetical protein ACK551_00905 [Vampirovibrionales bacterium]